ncbi:MAG: 50S ribosomal protein L23 [Patescibacteria group bacterium]
MNKFLIKNPLITEKGTDMGVLGKYLFLVRNNATKPEIKKVIEGEYKVKVTDVNIINTKPKARRLGRTKGVKPGYKKAIVTLKAGQKLDILPQ